MIFNFNRKTFITREIAGALCNRPALEYAVPTKPEIVVKLSRRVLLNHEGECLSIRARTACLDALRFRSDREVTHGAITR
jgi:hypothetical protein